MIFSSYLKCISYALHMESAKYGNINFAGFTCLYHRVEITSCVHSFFYSLSFLVWKHSHLVSHLRMPIVMEYQTLLIDALAQIEEIVLILRAVLLSKKMMMAMVIIMPLTCFQIIHMSGLILIEMALGIILTLIEMVTVLVMKSKLK